MVGSRILNYRLIKKIGQGGMASVYEAHHITFENRIVAIKILDPILSKNEDITKRFLNEAKVMASLEHQNIVKVIDFESENGVLAIIMEFLNGQNLKDAIVQNSLNETQKTEIFKQILQAIDYGHKLQIIHRDIKPSNIFLVDKFSKVKVLDFGIAKMLDSDNQQTITGMSMGTPMFMSPEQVKGNKDINQKSDIYSLGVVLYYIFSGQTPYDVNDSQYNILTKIVNNPLPDLKNNDKINFIIKKATAKNPHERFQNCMEFYDAFDNNTELSGFFAINPDFFDKKPEAFQNQNEKIISTVPEQKNIEEEKSKIKDLESLKRFVSENKDFEPDIPQAETPKLEPKKKKKNNKWLLIFTLLLIAFTLFFINKKNNLFQKNTWSENYGGLENEEAFTILADENGILVGGLTKSYGISMDWYIMKVNYSGTNIWQKNIDGFNKGDVVHKIIKTNDDNYLAVGGSYQDNTYKSQNRVMKFDEKGNNIWNKFYGYYGWEEAADVTQANDNSFILIFNDNTEDNTRCGIFKIDEKGNLLWEMSTGDDGDYCARDILKINDNEYMICGEVNYSNKTIKAFFTKIDSYGNVIFKKVIGEKEKSLNPRSMTLSKSGSIIVVGFADFKEGKENDVWIAKIKTDGELITNSYIAESQNQAALCVSNANDDNYVLAGYTSVSENNIDGLIIKFTDDLNILWRKTFGNTYNDKFNDITITKKNIIATGYTTIEDDNKDIWIVKIKN